MIRRKQITGRSLSSRAHCEQCETGGWGDGGGWETRGKGGGARRGWGSGVVQIRGQGRKTREGREEGRGGGGGESWRLVCRCVIVFAF